MIALIEHLDRSGVNLLTGTRNSFSCSEGHTEETEVNEVKKSLIISQQDDYKEKD